MTTPITKDLKRKKSTRRLHPQLRLLIEEKLFEDGIVPTCFLQRNIQSCVIATAIAMEKLNIREKGGENRGELVGYIQGVVGGFIPGGTGDPWCMSTIQCIVAFLEDYFQFESPLPDTESVMNCYSSTKNNPEIFLSSAEEGSFFLFQSGERWMGHAGTVLEVLPDNKMRTFEGNTGHASIRDGDGAYFRDRDQGKNGPLTTKGFVRAFPNNSLE